MCVPAAINLVLFLVMAEIWGTSWAAMKLGLYSIPPAFLGGARFALAAALLVNTATYALIFRGLEPTPSGLVALLWAYSSVPRRT
jgi:drug/metabolite transporter (DMT)-like permease